MSKFCDVLKGCPLCLEPFRNINEEVKEEFSKEGFRLYATVKATTLVYDPETDCFLKILHPMTIKSRVLFYLTDRARSIYNISEHLLSQGTKVQPVAAYGFIKKGRRPFFAIKKVAGESLYDILIRGGKTPGMETYRNAISEVARIHGLGYWLGDAHLSHIFIKGTEVSGLIDIDGIRKNRPFMLKNLAKDIAGLNHPELPLTKDEKMSLLDHYLDAVEISKKTPRRLRGVKKKFIQLIKHYTERRWK